MFFVHASEHEQYSVIINKTNSELNFFIKKNPVFLAAEHLRKHRKRKQDIYPQLRWQGVGTRRAGEGPAFWLMVRRVRATIESWCISASKNTLLVNDDVRETVVRVLNQAIEKIY